MTWQQVIQDAIDAVSLGSTYALFALGIALIFGVMNLVNFAHGEFIMAGAYAIVLLADTPALAVLVSLATAVLIALTAERVAFRPVRGATAATLLVTSFALSYLLQNVATLIFSSFPKVTAFGASLLTPFTVAGLQIPKSSVLIVGVTVFALVTLGLFLNRTFLGTQMRASAEDFDMARLLGVRANRVISAAFAISGILASLAGTLLIVQTGSVSPTLGVTPVLIGFMATIVGGMGSLQGAVLGGFALGSATVVLQATLPIGLLPFRDAFVFLGVLAALILRPEGLLVARSRATRI